MLPGLYRAPTAGRNQAIPKLVGPREHQLPVRRAHDTQWHASCAAWRQAPATASHTAHAIATASPFCGPNRGNLPTAGRPLSATPALGRSHAAIGLERPSPAAQQRRRRRGILPRLLRLRRPLRRLGCRRRRVRRAVRSRRRDRGRYLDSEPRAEAAEHPGRRPNIHKARLPGQSAGHSRGVRGAAPASGGSRRGVEVGAAPAPAPAARFQQPVCWGGAFPAAVAKGTEAATAAAASAAAAAAIFSTKLPRN